MKTATRISLPSVTRRFALGKLALAGLLALTLTAPLQGVVPTRNPSPLRFSGMYKVISSSDPVFSSKGEAEWFLDFGEGVTSGRSSGTVAVTLRRNPNLKIRILVWQYYPETGNLIIGNQVGQGARQAVTLADWKIRGNSDGLRLNRGSYHVVLQPASPDE